ncbi:hypothetical protein [uncultured Cellulomonas sp.]|uniref:hypothetical protein n=1 Tax=uncultured Cellulomonas sp. TaxID=189682 RepID=UPI002624AF76|nr:hypothetical protein [uncultured Cellulomonas sp.]
MDPDLYLTAFRHERADLERRRGHRRSAWERASGDGGRPAPAPRPTVASLAAAVTSWAAGHRRQLPASSPGPECCLAV